MEDINITRKENTELCIKILDTAIKKPNHYISSENLAIIRSTILCLNQCIDAKLNNQNQLQELIENHLAIQTQIKEIKENINNTYAPSHLSYANVTRFNTANNQSLTDKNPNKELVIVKPNDPNVTNTNDLHKLCFDHINKSKNKVIKITKNRHSVKIVCTNKEDATKLQQELSANQQVNQNSRIFVPKKLNPVIIINNVSNFIDSTNIIQHIIDYNDSISKVHSDYKILFERVQNNTKNVFLRVNPNVYQELVNMGFKIFLPGQLCKITTKVLIKQCQNCFMFSHKTNECKNTKICINCSHSIGSSPHTCTGSNICINCDHLNKKNKNSSLDTNHKPNHHSCPIYQDHITKTKNQTQYTP